MSRSSSDRPLMLRARPDVTAVAVRVAGSPRWVVTDPVTLAHYDLCEQEFALLEALVEGASLRDLQRAFEKRFAPRRITLDEVWEFVSRLHRAGLAVATGAGQGGELHEKQAKDRRQRVAWAWTRLLAIKLPGVNPDGVLDAIRPLTRWLFCWPVLLFALSAIGWGASIVLADFSAFVAGMPALADLATPSSLAALAVTALAIKVLHELGHAITCKQFGGRVPEMGVLLLAFAPAMYCDVTDLWRLPSKWKRIAVTCSGIAVELLLAAIAAIVWRYTDPGLLHTAALNVMIVCTVGTLMVNANPLLRYDGYYLLSDLAETPNLWQRSREAFGALATDWLARRDRKRPPIEPWWLPVYGLASQLYLVVVLVSIVWVLATTLRPHRLEMLAYLAGTVALAGTLAGPARKLIRWSRDPVAKRKLRGGRAAIALAIATAALFALWRIPVRYSVEGRAEVVLDQAEVVVTTVEGRLEEAALVGERVEVGAVLARIANPDIEQELIGLRGQLAEAELRVKHLRALRASDHDANDELPAAESDATDLRDQLTALRHEAARLVIRARRAGVVIGPKEVPSPAPGELTLATWSGAPLDRQNLGAWLTTGQEVCRLGEPDLVVARVSLDEDDIERVRVGQRVALAWRQSPGEVSYGEVIEVSERVIRESSDSRQSQAAPPRYFARVELTARSRTLLVGGEGRARIDTGQATLGPLVVTRARQWFRLP